MQYCISCYFIASSQRFNRATNAESVINGMVVPKGVDVTVSVYALHHDPDVWIEPEKFDPDRYFTDHCQKKSISLIASNIV